MASTFSCALAIISSTSGILIATVGLLVALINLIRIGKLTISVYAPRLSTASAACLCASTCSLQTLPIHFLIALICSLFFLTSSSSTNLNTSSSSSLRPFVVLCPYHLLVFQGPLPSFRLISFARPYTSGPVCLPKLMSTSAPFKIVCLFAFTAQKILWMTLL